MSESVQTSIVALLVIGAAGWTLWRFRKQGAGSSTCAKCSGCGSDDPACVRGLREKLAQRPTPNR